MAAADTALLSRQRSLAAARLCRGLLGSSVGGAPGSGSGGGPGSSLRSCLKGLRELPGLYVRAAAARPGLLLAFWALIPLAAIGGWVAQAGGLPRVDTDVTSSSYLRVDGPVSDRFEILSTALQVERQRLEAANLASMLESALTSGRRITSADRTERQWLNNWVTVYYESAHADGNIFRSEVLDDIFAFEQRLTQLPSYRRFCLAPEDMSKDCADLLSAQYFFRGEHVDVSANEYLVYPNGASSELDNVSAVLKAMAEPIDGSTRLWYFDEDFPHSRVMRSRARFGRPLPGFLDSSDPTTQDRLYKDFVKDELHPLLVDASTKNVKIRYGGDVLTEYETMLLLIADGTKGLVSLVLVYIYMAIYTRAPLVAAMGMLTILLSIPLGVVFFAVCGNPSLPAINLLVLFLLTGLGADNLFMLMCAWRQSKTDCEDIVSRLRMTLLRAGRPIVVCNATTAGSFVASLWSSVRSLRSFGLFLTLCLAANLVLCLGMFPPVLILREETKRRKTFVQRLSEGGTTMPEDVTLQLPVGTDLPLGEEAESHWEEAEEDLNAEGGDGVGDLMWTSAEVGSAASWLPSNISTCAQAETDDAVIDYSRSEGSDRAPAAGASGDQGHQVASGRMERFFSKHYAPMVWRRRKCFVAMGALLCLTGAVVTGTCLKAARGVPALVMRDSDNLGNVGYLAGLFPDGLQWTSDTQRLPLSVCNASCAAQRAAATPGAPGTANASGLPAPSPSLSAAEGQLANSQVVHVSVVFGLPDASSKDDITMGAKFNFSLPSAQSAAARLCALAVERRQELSVRRAKCFVDEFREFLRERNCGMCTFPIVPAQIASDLLNEFMWLPTSDWHQDFGFDQDGVTVQWFRVRFITDIPVARPAEEELAWQRKWDQFIFDFNQDYAQTPGVGQVFQTSEVWVRAEFEARLVGAALQGAVASLGFSLVAVVFFLGDITLGLLVMASVLCIVVCLAAMVFGVIGWPLGAVEAIAMAIVMGLSVDYSLHLAEAFRLSTAETRRGRVQEALRRIGGAIVGAGATSTMACPPIFLCSVQVFLQFGLIVVLNVILSLFFCVTFLAALLALVGPMRSYGGGCGGCCAAVAPKAVPDGEGRHVDAPVVRQLQQLQVLLQQRSQELRPELPPECAPELGPEAQQKLPAGCRVEAFDGRWREGTLLEGKRDDEPWKVHCDQDPVGMITYASSVRPLGAGQLPGAPAGAPCSGEALEAPKVAAPLRVGQRPATTLPWAARSRQRKDSPRPSSGRMRLPPSLGCHPQRRSRSLIQVGGRHSDLTPQIYGKEVY